jgi:hypothetical protein
MAKLLARPEQQQSSKDLRQEKLSFYRWAWEMYPHPPPTRIFLRPKRRHDSLLESHAMPSLRDLAHDGVLCIFSNRSAPDRAKWWPVGSVRAGGMDRPSHPAGSLSSSQPGGPPCWARPLFFGLIGSIHTYLL